MSGIVCPNCGLCNFLPAEELSDGAQYLCPNCEIMLTVRLEGSKAHFEIGPSA